MAKKRKLRSSEPESTKIDEPEPPQIHEPAIEEEEEQEQEEEEQEEEGHQNRETMAVDDHAPPEQPHEEEQNADEEEVHREEEPFVEQQGEQERQHRPQNADEEKSDPAAAIDDGNENEDDNEEDDEPVEKLLEPFTKEQLQSLVKQVVEKHPDLMDSVRLLADVDPAHRKIFVHGLGWDTTAETLTGVFGKYGEIEDCKAVADKVSGKSKGYAFILFKHRSGARKALKEPQKKIGNRTTSCQLASAGPVSALPSLALPVSEHTQRKIFVSNVNAEIDPQRLLEFFKQFGEVEDGPLGLDKQTGKPKGFAFFVYKSVESAKKALEEPHKNFEGYILYCQKAIDGLKGNKGYHQQQQQHHHQQQQQHHHQHQHQHQHQHHSQHLQSHYHSRKEKNKYSSGSGGQPSGHLIAPSAPVMGFNPGVSAQALNPALGQALTTLLVNQGAGLGIGNLLGGLGGAAVNQAGPPAGYGNQAAVRYGNQPGMQPGYQNPQMGQNSGVRPYPGTGSSYMG